MIVSTKVCLEAKYLNLLASIRCQFICITSFVNKYHILYLEKAQTDIMECVYYYLFCFVLAYSCLEITSCLADFSLELYKKVRSDYSFSLLVTLGISVRS